MVNITVKLHKNDQHGRENIDSALRRFKNKLDQEEIMEAVKRKRSFETPKQIKVRKQKRLHKKLKEIKSFSSKKN